MNDRDRFEDLVSRYLDARLEHSERDELLRLLHEPERQRDFMEMTRIHSEIAGALSTPVPDTAMAELVLQDIGKAAPAEENQRLKTTSLHMWNVVRPRSLRWGAAFGALVIGIVGMMWLFAPNKRPRIDFLAGVVRVAEVAAEPSQPLRFGQPLETVGETAQADVVLVDGSRVTVHGKSKVTFFAKGALLETGTAQVNVAGAAGRILVFTTSDAEVIAAAARFTLTAGNHTTRVSVNQGSVRFRRRSDSAELQVRAGESALFQPGEPFQTRPVQHH